MRRANLREVSLGKRLETSYNQEAPSWRPAMNNTVVDLPARSWTAAELRRLPPDRRDILLAEAALRAAPDYEQDHSLTDFEAFGKADLHGDSADTQPR
jgi:hypothetical protein